DPEAGAYVSGFTMGAYDPSLPLVLDPVVLGYAGFIGGNGLDKALDVAVDSDGSAYVVGETNSTADFPLLTGPDLTLNGADAFIVKVHSTGQNFVYAGFIGGNDAERANGVAVDRLGYAYVTGQTWSTAASFPAKVGPRLTRSAGGSQSSDAFVVKVNTVGT